MEAKEDERFLTSYYHIRSVVRLMISVVSETKERESESINVNN